MTYKEPTDTQKQAYMKFWSERKPESFALEVWLHKMAILLREFRPNFSKENKNIFQYVEFFGVIFHSDTAPSPVHGIHKNMTIVESHMRLIHKHEKRGTSLVAVSAIEDRLSEVYALLKAAAQEDDWDSIIAGEKRLHEPLDIEGFLAYNKYSWLSQCHTAQDVAATLWSNFFNRFLKEVCEKHSSYMTLFNLGLISPLGTEPRFTIDMPLGALSAPSHLSFCDIVAEAVSCIPSTKERFPKNLYIPQVADDIKNQFVKKAKSFIEKMAPNPTPEFRASSY